MVQESQTAGTEEDPKVWGEPADRTAYDSDNLFGVEILSHEKVEDDSLAMPYNYTVRWINIHGASTSVTDVPHQAFVFVDAAGTGDQLVITHFVTTLVSLTKSLLATRNRNVESIDILLVAYISSYR
jgi:hypothetical protein